MQPTVKSKSIKALERVLAFAPWVLSMYVLYWLEHGQVWTTETAHRGKMSVAILTTGMVLSFLIHSYFIRGKRK